MVQMSPENMECVLVLRGRKRVVAGGVHTEARNGVATLQHFLNDFQRPTSQITETKTTLTPGMAVRKNCLQYSIVDIITCFKALMSRFLALRSSRMFNFQMKCNDGKSGGFVKTWEGCISRPGVHVYF